MSPTALKWLLPVPLPDAYTSACAARASLDDKLIFPSFPLVSTAACQRAVRQLRCAVPMLVRTVWQQFYVLLRVR